jgi:hypothetical protein
MLTALLNKNINKEINIFYKSYFLVYTRLSIHLILFDFFWVSLSNFSCMPVLFSPLSAQLFPAALGSEASSICVIPKGLSVLSCGADNQLCRNSFKPFRCIRDLNEVMDEVLSYSHLLCKVM